MRDRLPLLAGLALSRSRSSSRAVGRRRDPRPQPEQRDHGHRLGEEADQLRLRRLGPLRVEPERHRGRRSPRADRWARKVRAFLDGEDLAPGELAVDPVSSETVTDDHGGSDRLPAHPQLRGAVEPGRRDRRDRRAQREAARRGRADPAAARLVRVHEAGVDQAGAARRGDEGRAGAGTGLVGATGGHLGSVRGVDVGVFQVTAPNSTEVSDYGEYDTSTLRKDVTAVVNVTFALG